MKQWIFTFLALVGLQFAANGQIVITEIGYNNPSFDDYEYIELYNNSASMVDLSNWTFTQGITYTFPSGVTLMPGAYQVLSPDSVAFLAAFGVASRQMPSNSLSNSGEDVILVDAMGNGIDTVDYDDGNGWPEIADGNGPSLILCDVNADNNDVSNWSFSTRPTGFIWGDEMIFGSPGIANDTCATSPTVFFRDLVATVNEGAGSVDVDMIMANTGSADTMTVDLALGMGSTATAGSDFTFSTTAVGIGPGSSGIGDRTFVTVSIPIIDDMDLESDETIVLTLTNPQGGAIAATGDLTITITDNETPLPLYPIGLITADSAGDGLPDSLGVMCRIEGVVHGIDLQGGSNISFTTIDATGGIGLFSTNDFGYTVAEGDSVMIQGTVDHFNGLAQMENLDTIIFLSSGNPTVMPDTVTVLDETTENELVTLECVSLVNPSQWPTTVGFGVNVDVTDGTNTFTIRIDSDTDLNGTPAPSTSQFNVTGIGGQFDGSFPHNDGYQLLPRYMADVVEKPDTVSAVKFDVTALTANEGDGMVSFDVSLVDPGSDTVAVDVSLDVANSTAMMGADFSWSDTTIVFPANATMPISLSVMLVDDSDVESDETIVLTLANPTNAALGDSVLTLTIEDNDLPAYPIALVTADADGNGVPDSAGVRCQVQGIVHGVDLQGAASSNLLFTIIDSTGGIGCFMQETQGYMTVQEGDEVILIGEIEHFNGLGQMDPDTAILVSTGNATVTPVVVTALDETTESELVTLECVAIIDTADWPDPATTFSGANVDVTNGVDTFTVRIDRETDVNGMPLPMNKWLTITGIGGQFDGSDPRTSGYQLLPRYMADVVENPNPTVGFTTGSSTVSEAAGSTMAMIDQADGNPDTTMVTVTLDGSSTATNGTDFSFTDTTFMMTGCGAASASLPITIIDDLDVEGDETIVLTITMVTNDAMTATATQTITIEDDATDNIEDLLPANAVRVYPNPATDLIRIESSYRMESISIVNLFGQEIAKVEPSVSESSIAVADLAAGVYLMKVQTAEGTWTGRFVKQ